MAENSFFKAALTKAMSYCARREYCIYDIQNKLISWGVGNKDIDKIVGALKKENFINEGRYAIAFTKDKFKYNKWGKVKIAFHLKAKGIAGEIIRTSLDAIDNELYTKTIRELISDHRRSVKAKNQYDLKAKLLRYGLSKGFERSLLYDLLNDLEE